MWGLLASLIGGMLGGGEDSSGKEGRNKIKTYAPTSGGNSSFISTLISSLAKKQNSTDVGGFKKYLYSGGEDFSTMDWETLLRSDKSNVG